MAEEEKPDADLMRDAAARKIFRRMAERQRLAGMAARIPMLRASARFGDPLRVAWHLENWRAWRRSGEAGPGYISVAQGLTNGGASRDFADMVEAEDRRCAAIMHAIILALPPAQRIAVMVDAGFEAAVYRFRVSQADMLAAARASIANALRVRGVW